MSRYRPLRILLLGACLGGLACESTPRDQNFGTDAEADFDAPADEVKPRDGGTDADAAEDTADATDAAETGDADTADAVSDDADAP